MIVVSSARNEPTSIMSPGSADPFAGAPCAFKGCRGVLYPGSGPVGIVLCPPWGFEDLVMRKSWRLLGEALAGAGFPCLRFDYPGTGNSLGAMTDIVEAAQWTQAVCAGADFLRAYSGVKRFVFVGQSLGAALAVEAASLRSDVVGLVAIAPVIKGRTYIRELVATSKLVAEKIRIRIELEPGEGLNVLGFSMSDRLLDSLKAVDLMKALPPSLKDAIVFDQADRKAGADLSEHFKRNGIASRLEIVPPYHLMISDATSIQPLPVTAAQVVAALTALYPRAAPLSPARVPHLPATLRAALFREEPIRFGPGLGLQGTLCVPANTAAGVPVVLFLNRGLNPQIGWRRVSVDHARTLAAQGFTSLRIDAAGLGESADAPGRDAGLIYSDVLIDDVRAAIDALASRGHDRIMLVGICSGAFLALSTAYADPRITDVVAVNAQRLVWNPKENAEDVIRYGLRSMDDYVGDLTTRHALRKLIRSRERIVPAALFFLKQAFAKRVARFTRPIQARLMQHSMPARVTDLFATLSDRGTRVSLVYCAGDPGLRELSGYFGRQGRELRTAHSRVSILPDADHNLTTARASDFLADHIERFGRDRSPRDEARGSSERARVAAEAYAPARALRSH